MSKERKSQKNLPLGKEELKELRAKGIKGNDWPNELGCHIAKTRCAV